MTQLKSTVRRTVVGADGREYVVSLTLAGVIMREKGKRTEYGPVPYGKIWLEGAKLQAASNIAERRKPRVSRNVLSLR